MATVGLSLMLLPVFPPGMRYLPRLGREGWYLRVIEEQTITDGLPEQTIFELCRYLESWLGKRESHLVVKN